MPMQQIDTGLVDIIADDDTTPSWIWMTGPIPTTELQYVRPNVWLGALTQIKARVAVQFSDDGVTWSDSEKELFTTYITAEGWSHGTSFYDLFNVTSTTPRRFVRFGLQTLTTTGSKVVGGQARLRLEPRPMVGRSVAGGVTRVNSTGSTSTWNFIPLTADVDGRDIEEVRVTFEVFGVSSDCEVKIGYRETDAPDDPTSYGSATEVDGTTLTTDDTDYGTTFVSLTPTKGHVQFGAMVQNSTGDQIEGALVRVIVEVRRTC